MPSPWESAMIRNVRYLFQLSARKFKMPNKKEGCKKKNNKETKSKMEGERTERTRARKGLVSLRETTKIKRTERETNSKKKGKTGEKRKLVGPFNL